MKSDNRKPLIISNPLSIDAQVHSFESAATGLPALNFAIPHINIARLTSRYISGGSALKQGREVSRKRLSIAQAGIQNGDTYAHTIATQIERFELALKLCAQKEMSVELLCDMHTLITPEENSRGRIREHQNWVGADKIENATVVPPPPAELNKLISEWEAFVKHEDITKPANALLAFSYFIASHPFADGNGRLSRLLLTSFLSSKREFSSFLSPTLYRLNHFEQSREELFATPRALIGGSWNDVISYWERAFAWQNGISQVISERINSVWLALSSQLALYCQPVNAIALLKLLFDYPLVTLEMICKHLKLRVSDANELLTSFCDLGILKCLKLKQPAQMIVFSCEKVFELWAKIDDLLFDPASFTAERAIAEVGGHQAV